MTLETLFISATDSAIDCALYAKGMALTDHASEHDFNLQHVAAIGDGANDLPFMMLDNLGFIGCPANADASVKAAAKEKGGFESKYEVYLGFLDFLGQCVRRNIKAVYTDRDGVLQNKGDFPGAFGFAQSLGSAGRDGNPLIYVLTGAGQAENRDFIKAVNSFFDLADNAEIRADPYIVLTENGGVRVSILDSEKSVNIVQQKNPALFAKVLGPFRDSLVKRLESEIAPKFNLGVTYEYNNQKGNAYVATKQTMVTVNVPRAFADGRLYRNTPEAEAYRTAMKAAAADIAKSIGIQFKVLERE